MHYYTQECQGHAHSRQFFMKNCCHGMNNQCWGYLWGIETVGLARDQVKGYLGSTQGIQMYGNRGGLNPSGWQAPSSYFVSEDKRTMTMEFPRRSSLLSDPGSKFICEKLENTGRKKKEHTRKKRDSVRTAEPNRRDQVTATKSWPKFPSSEGKGGRLSGSSTY
jgi:hypothetical protein